jgi:hypothetical protein
LGPKEVRECRRMRPIIKGRLITSRKLKPLISSVFIEHLSV